MINTDSVRTGVLTLHYGFNEGAVLQSMATCQLLGLAGDSEVVDHRYPAKLAAYGEPETPRALAIQESINDWLPLSPKRFESADCRGTLDYCSKRYDSLIVGSDVVWALRYIGRLRSLIPGGLFPKQRDLFFPAFPNVYWPDQQVNCRKIAYAASCGNLDPREIPRRDLRSMARILDSFSGISVRDAKTLSLVRRCSSELAERTAVVPDPTIAFNLLEAFDGSSALKKLRQAGFDDSSRWVLLIMKEAPVSRVVISLLKERGYRVAATGGFGGESDIDISECGLSPLEWGWMPRYFALNVTERMHACIFSVLNETPVLAFDMNHKVTGEKTKLQERMEAFQLGRNYRHQSELSEEEIGQALDVVVEEASDWEVVRRVILSEQEVAKQFLVQSLGE